jgi:hypothetical protein
MPLPADSEQPANHHTINKCEKLFVKQLAPLASMVNLEPAITRYILDCMPLLNK